MFTVTIHKLIKLMYFVLRQNEQILQSFDFNFIDNFRFSKKKSVFTVFRTKSLTI